MAWARSVAVVRGLDTILLRAYGFADLEYHVPTPERAIYEQFATKYLPRTYIIDQKGTILWMDIEYSRSMRNEFRNAMWYYLDPTSS